MRRNPEGGVRRYKSPGKFEGEMLVTSFLYGMDTDEEVGDVNELGWYGRIDLPDEKSRRELISLLRDAAKEAGVEEGEEFLTDGEKKMVMGTIGIIVSESEQGFFSAQWFDKGEKKKFKDAWQDIEDEYEKFYGEAE